MEEKRKFDRYNCLECRAYTCDNPEHEHLELDEEEI